MKKIIIGMVAVAIAISVAMTCSANLESSEHAIDVGGSRSCRE